MTPTRDHGGSVSEIGSADAHLRVLSLGWGVQSWTLVAMVALGEIEPIDAAIHADTGWERQETYRFAAKWAPWLEGHGVRVQTVRDESSRGAVADGYGGVFLPAFTSGATGDGQIRRQCTGQWKIDPIRRTVRTLLAERGQRTSPGVVTQIMGISYDEASRARSSDVQYITHVFPLIDRRMQRTDCIRWLLDHKLPVPPKSSCTFCPYHSKQAWRNLKRAGGADWDQAVAVDAAIRNRRPPWPLYVHPARKPLADAVTIPEDAGWHQASLIDGEDDEDGSCATGFCFV